MTNPDTTKRVRGIQVSRHAPAASSPLVRSRMQAVPRTGTRAEIRIRSALHRLGLRFHVDRRPLPNFRRRADVVFVRAKVAVFVDGCFWHGCARHHRPPRSHGPWWALKVRLNRQRDRDTDALLRASGWAVVRVWEHATQGASLTRSVARIARTVEVATWSRQGAPTGVPRK